MPGSGTAPGGRRSRRPAARGEARGGALKLWADGYGDLWWTTPEGAFAATGRGGQLILVVPELDLVIGVTADLPDGDAWQSSRFVWDRLVAPLQ